MNRKYSPYEKEILRQIMFALSMDLKPFIRSDKDPGVVGSIVLRKIDHAIEKFEVQKCRELFRALDRIVPEKRGKEECDCHKGTHMCGCRVGDYNQCVDQIKYSIKELKALIKENEMY